jgi:hypothetical protein
LAIQVAGSGTRIDQGGKLPPRRITMPRQASAPDSHATVKAQAVDLYQDFEHEVEREAHSPHDSSQSDVLVRKHINGLVIAFFILIPLLVLAAIAGYAMHTH